MFNGMLILLIILFSWIFRVSMRLFQLMDGGLLVHWKVGKVILLLYRWKVMGRNW